MGWLPLVGLLVGFVAVYFSPGTIPANVAPYVSVAAVAGVDSIFGGIRSGIEGKFHADIFLSGFLMNTLLAGLLAYLGDRIGVDIYVPAVFVLVWRIFLNLSLIRRYYLTQWALRRKTEG